MCPPLATTTAIMRCGIDSLKDFRYNDVMFFLTFKVINFRTAIDVARLWICNAFIWLYKFSIVFKSGLLRGHPWKGQTPFFLCCCLVDFALWAGQVCDALVNGNPTHLRIIFLAFSENGSYLHLLVISKQIKLQISAWRQMKENSMKFPNFTNFCPFQCFKAELWPFLYVDILS